MRRALVIAAMFPLWMVSAATVLANAAPPPPRPEPAPRPEPTRLVAPVVIKYGLRGEDGAVKAKIQIPAALVHGAAGGGGPAPTSAAPPTTPPNGPAPQPEPAPENQSRVPPLGTIIAGIALSLAAVSVVFMIRGKRATKTAAGALLAVSLVLGGWSAAQADIPVAPRPPQIVIELVKEGETVTLLLPR